MAEKNADLLTVGGMATKLRVTEGKVKKAIQELGLKPTLRKGPCSYYDTTLANQILKAIKK